MPTIHQYHELALKQLGILKNSELQLTTFLEVMKNKASDSILKLLIHENRQNTRIRFRCLEKISPQEPAEFTTGPVEGINGIIKEGFDLLEKESDPVLIDAVILHILLLMSYYKLGNYHSVLLYFTPLEFKEESKLIDQAFKLEEYSLQEISDTMASHYANHTRPLIIKPSWIVPEKLDDLLR